MRRYNVGFSYFLLMRTGESCLRYRDIFRINLHYRENKLYPKFILISINFKVNLNHTHSDDH